MFHNKTSSKFTVKCHDNLGEFQMLFVVHAPQNRYILECSEKKSEKVGIFVCALDQEMHKNKTRPFGWMDCIS